VFNKLTNNHEGHDGPKLASGIDTLGIFPARQGLMVDLLHESTRPLCLKVSSPVVFHYTSSSVLFQRMRFAFTVSLILVLALCFCISLVRR
jgi:hypothetical protein